MLDYINCSRGDRPSVYFCYTSLGVLSQVISFAAVPLVSTPFVRNQYKMYKHINHANNNNSHIIPNNKHIYIYIHIEREREREREEIALEVAARSAAGHELVNLSQGLPIYDIYIYIYIYIYI